MIGGGNIQRIRYSVLITTLVLLVLPSLLLAGADTCWVHRFAGTGDTIDVPRAIVTDDAGNVYVVGYTTNTENQDFFTIKYRFDGDTAWIRYYRWVQNDVAYAVAVDTSGNVYVTGESWDPVSNWDIVTVKYDSSGTELWVRRYDGDGHSFDGGRAIAVDWTGNVTVVGQVTNAEGNYDFATIKYNSDGAFSWASFYDDTWNDLPVDLAIDASNNILVTGRSQGEWSYPGYDYATVKYGSVVFPRYDGHQERRV